MLKRSREVGFPFKLPLRSLISVVVSETNAFAGDFTYSCFHLNVYISKATPLMLQKAGIKIRFLVLCGSTGAEPYKKILL